MTGSSECICSVITVEGQAHEVWCPASSRKEVTYEIESFDASSGECVLRVRIDIKSDAEKAAFSAFIAANPQGRARMLLQAETEAGRESGMVVHAEG